MGGEGGGVDWLFLTLNVNRAHTHTCKPVQLNSYVNTYDKSIQTTLTTWLAMLRREQKRLREGELNIIMGLDSMLISIQLNASTSGWICVMFVVRLFGCWRCWRCRCPHACCYCERFCFPWPPLIIFAWLDILFPFFCALIRFIYTPIIWKSITTTHFKVNWTTNDIRCGGEGGEGGRAGCVSVSAQQPRQRHSKIFTPN